MVYFSVDSPLRPLFALWFLLLCPGLAFVHILDIRDLATVFSLSVALSIALDAIVAGLLIYANVWAPKLALAILIGLCIEGVIIKLIVILYRQRAGRLKGAQ